MFEYDLTPRDALNGMRIGISVSDSQDLERLGLSQAHAEMAVGEIARAVLIAGGHLVYGGRIKPSGFTQYLIHEVTRYGCDHAKGQLTLCLAAPEHHKLSRHEYDEVDRELGAKGRIVCLDESGHEIENISNLESDNSDSVSNLKKANSYSAMRHYMGTITDARVVIGGQLSNFTGRMPGIVEEAITAIKARQPVYVSAGFGGAAALVAKRLRIDDLDWAPADFPTRPKDKRIDLALDELDAAVSSKGWNVTLCGLSKGDLQQLAASYRAGEIASLVVRGLAQRKQSV